jgi:hypothetical protein
MAAFANMLLFNVGLLVSGVIRTPTSMKAVRSGTWLGEDGVSAERGFRPF